MTEGWAETSLKIYEFITCSHVVYIIVKLREN